MDIYKRDAIAAYGSPTALAEALGISRPAVVMWPDNRPIPQRHALRLRYELKPDVFGPPPSVASKRAKKKAA